MHMHKIIIIQGQYSSHQAYTHKKGGEKHTLTMQENKKKNKKKGGIMAALWAPYLDTDREVGERDYFNSRNYVFLSDDAYAERR